MLQVVNWVISIITLVLAYGGAVLALFCLVDATTRRADAYAAADKQTKGTWVAITVACAIVMGLAVWYGAFQPPTSILWLAALIGVLVYLVDVRPRLREVSGPGRR